MLMLQRVTQVLVECPSTPAAGSDRKGKAFIMLPYATGSRHANKCTRTLVLSHIHTQHALQYK